MTMIVYKKVEISASHRLVLPYDSPCNNLHGHNYCIEVWAEGDLNLEGMVVDFVVISEVIKQYDHKHLNDLFCNPTAERFVVEIFGELKTRFPKCDALRVRVWETPACYAEETWRRTTGAA